MGFIFSLFDECVCGIRFFYVIRIWMSRLLRLRIMSSVHQKRGTLEVSIIFSCC